MSNRNIRSHLNATTGQIKDADVKSMLDIKSIMQYFPKVSIQLSQL